MSKKVPFLIIFLFGFVWVFPWAQDQPLTKIPKSRCRISFPSDSRIKWFCYHVESEKALEDLLGSHLEATLRFNRIDRQHARRGAYLKIPVNFKDIVGFTPLPQKLERAENYSRYLFFDQLEQYGGAYEFGELKFSFPIASGRKNSTPTGVFKILGRDRKHRSSLYTLKPGIFYPMYWGIKFYVSRKKVAFWIHSRDMPGYPASHGCVGLYDEEMQKKFYGYPDDPFFLDSKKVYLWFFPDGENDKPYSYPNGLPGALIEIK